MQADVLKEISNAGITFNLLCCIRSNNQLVCKSFCIVHSFDINISKSLLVCFKVPNFSMQYFVV